MLASKLIARSCLKQNLSAAAVVQPCRTYALSRFPHEKRPGSGRARERVVRVPPRQRRPTPEQEPEPEPLFNFPFFNLGPKESKPSAEESPLWEEASQRAPPSGNSTEGLSRLLMDNNVLVVTRQIEMLNIFVGFEQSNRYVISNEMGDTLGYIAEEPRGIFSMFSRQIFRTHRPFRAVVMDSFGSPILWLRRPFAWINSRMFVQRLSSQETLSPEGEPVLDTFAEVQQRWHLWRRRYELFLRDTPRRILSVVSDPQPEPELEDDVFNQFALIDEGLWAWHFDLKDARGEAVASVNRAFRGLGREIFTDTGQYFIRFGPAPVDPLDNTTPRAPSVIRDLTLEERALVLAMAVNIDFDYFSRHSHGGGLGMPLFFGSSEYTNSD